MNKKVGFALAFRLLFTLIAIIGVVLNTKLFTSEFEPTTFLYYTTQSNLLAFSLFGYLFIATLLNYKRDKTSSKVSFAPTLSFIIMINITLTFIVFWTLLAPGMIGTSYRLLSFSNLAVHTFTPLAVVFEYLYFNQEHKLKYRTTLLTLVYPLIYSLAAFIIGGFRLIEYYSFGIEYAPIYFPYFFFDFHEYGGRVLYYIFGIALFLLLLANASYFALKQYQRRILLNKKLTTQ